MFPREVLKLILESLETGTFWRKTRRINDPRQEVNRHGIAHGKFTGFESRDMALKYLVLLDGLVLLLLHDKMLTPDRFSRNAHRRPAAENSPQNVADRPLHLALRLRPIRPGIGR